MRSGSANPRVSILLHEDVVDYIVVGRRGKIDVLQGKIENVAWER